jgi:hypothetical protein
MSEDDEDDLANHGICAHCVGERYLSALIEREGDAAACSYCERVGQTMTMGDFATRVETALGQHYRQTSSEPEGIDYLAAKEGLWIQPGSPAAEVIAIIAKIDSAPAQDVLAILADRNYDHDAAAAGLQGPYDDEAQYEEAAVDVEALQAQWDQFQRTLQTESRLFNREAYRTLNSMFSDLKDHKASGGSVLTEAGPGKEISVLHRARVFQSSKGLKRALERPDLELGPPPASLAAAGRMNAHGIAVFYGATDPFAALAETRPPVGSRVLVGSFEILRPLQILDIEALSRLGAEASVFDPNARDALAKAKFLEFLAARIARPVLPDDAAFDYLVTQAIAEYLAGLGAPTVDGIVYPSVQAGDQRNVVLFRKAARVEEMEVPEGTIITAQLVYVDEDGARPDYSVHEATPPNGEVGHRPPVGRSLDEYFAAQEKQRDRRVPALKLIPKSLAVHEVEGVTFSSNKLPVTRQRSEQRVFEIVPGQRPKF